MHPNVLVFVLYACFHWKCVQSCDIKENAEVYVNGDIMIGSVIPIHEGVSNLLNRTNPDDYICAGLHIRNIVKFYAMLYTIEEINNSSLLPGIKLGYALYDSCSDVTKAIQSTIKLIPELNSLNMPPDCITKLNPSIKVIIGEINSESSIAISRILSLHSIPQISPASSAPNLSDKLRFPSFLRTVPSDVHQTQAVAKLIKKFGWNWVGIIASDDDYGHSAVDYLNTFFQHEGICLAFTKTIPTYVDHPLLQKEINGILDELQQCSANVVVIFAKGLSVIKIFKESIRRNITKIWIACDIWSTFKVVPHNVDISKVGTVLGLNFQADDIPGFTDYLQNLQPPKDDEKNLVFEKYKQFRFGCTNEFRKYLECRNSNGSSCIPPNSVKYKSPLTCRTDNIILANDDYLTQNIDWSTTFSTALAVKSIAYALKSILCKNGKCVKDLKFSPQELVKEILNVQFSYHGRNFSFDKYGDAMNGYSILNWHTQNNVTEFKIVGYYDILNSSFTMNESLLLWNTKDNKIPDSKCSTPCPPGYSKKHAFISCCYACVPCPEDYYSPYPDMDRCSECGPTQWSTNGSSKCEDRKREYFQWGNPFAITLMAFASLGLLFIIAMACLFTMHIKTPAVKIAGGNYTFLTIMALLFSLASIVFFIGQPSDIICKIRQPLYGISFTLCISCILIKALQINLSPEALNRFIYQPVVIIAGLVSIQICICILWLILKTPSYEETSTVPQLMLLQCDEGSYVFFGVMLGYIGLIALTCFILAYCGRKLQGKYNEANGITFSMLIYMLVWIIFIPIYMNTSGMYLPSVQVVAILASVYGVTFCHLLAACYIIFCKNNKRENYLKRLFLFTKVSEPMSSILPSNIDQTTTNSDAIVDGAYDYIEQKQCVVSNNISVRRRRKSM
uniref:G-protein coupled receptors family 3 profile domain-containing protein n=1 Tax=Leptobrachium leishanense TaxID=445787 RepID=A0A8C5PHI8_9ANUR